MKEDKPESPWIGKESELHSQIEAELKRRRWYFVHSRCDRKTTTQLGVADFICAAPNGITWWVECKKRGGKLSQEQTVTRHVLQALGHRWACVYSLKEFNDFIDGKMSL